MEQSANKKIKGVDVVTEDAWWCALRNIKEHKMQVHCSLVSKEWARLCKTLPDLHIVVPKWGKKKRESFVRAALRGRTGLKELRLEYCSGVLSTPVNEQRLWKILQAHSSSLECLEVQLTMGTVSQQFWSYVADFPSLSQLTFQHVKMLPSCSNNLKLWKLKYLHLEGKIPACVVEEAVKACPLLETINVNGLEGTLVVESRSLKNMHVVVTTKSELVINACNLKRLVIEGDETDHGAQTTIKGAQKLEELVLNSHRLRVFGELPDLKMLSFCCNCWETFESLLALGKDLEHLVIPDLPGDAMLEYIMPEKVEFLFFRWCWMYPVYADEDFQVGTEAEIFEMLKREDLPLKFKNLKQVTIVSMECRCIGNLELLRVLVELLRCSPKLEYLVLDLMDLCKPIERLVSLDSRLHVRSLCRDKGDECHCKRIYERCFGKPEL